MGRIFKWGIAAIVTALLGIGLLASVTYIIFVASVANTTGSYDINGLSSRVSLVREETGVLHIEAVSRNDAATALGFAHAQDRLWQMDIMRRTAQGRLSEVFGSDAIDVDIFMQTLGFAEQVETSFQALTAQARSELEAYATGVNRFLAIETRSLDPNLPPEFLIQGTKPEEWRPQHSLLVLKLMALQYSSGLDDQILRLRLAAQGLTPAELTDLLPPKDGAEKSSLPDIGDLVALNKPYQLRPDQKKIPAYFQKWLGYHPAPKFNLRVGLPSGFERKDPVVAVQFLSDLTAPSRLYLTHLSWRDEDDNPINTLGASLPGLPGIVMGKANDVFWSIVPPAKDNQQVIIEQVRGNPPEDIVTSTGWKPLSVEKRTLKLKGEATHDFAIRRSQRGPLLPHEFGKLHEILTVANAASIVWPGLETQDTTFDLIHNLPLIKSVTEFEVLTDTFGTAALSFELVSRSGSIKRITPGQVPTYRVDNPFPQLLPIPGWLPQLQSQGMRSVSSQSRWPGSILPDATEASLQFDQNTATAPQWMQLRDLMMKTAKPRPKFAYIFNRLRRWRGALDTNAPEPLIIASWYREVIKNVFQDELGPLIVHAYSYDAASLRRILGQGGARNWCDDITTPDISENCAAAVTDALDVTVADLTKKHGTNPADWTWGDEHISRAIHTPFANIWPISEFVDITAATKTEAGTTMQTTSNLADPNNPFIAMNGPGARAIFDFSSSDRALLMINSGQSGNPYSKFYRNLSEIWAAGRYLTVSNARQNYRSGSVSILTLEPET